MWTVLLIWDRLGFLVPVLPAAGLIGAKTACDHVLGDAYYAAHLWPKVVPLLASGIVLLELDRRFPGDRTHLFIDDITGERRLVGGPRHTFIFLSIRFWGWALLGLSACLPLMV